jgi:two-component system LytT family response regulator
LDIHNPLLPLDSMIKALIIEDEQKAADMLEIMLERNQPDVKVLEKCSNLPSGVRSIKKHKPDIIFLDIEMPGYSGLQLLEFFNEDEVDFSIIFTTAFNDYAIKAFELSAIDYILKPIQIDKLNAAVDKFKRKQQKDIASYEKLQLLSQNLSGGLKRIAVPVSSGVEIIKLEDIIYLQADGSYTKMILANEPPLVLSKNLKYFEDQVGENEGFFRNHRSYIINIAYIKKVLRSDGGTLQLTNGTSIPITTDRIDELVGLLSN